MTNPFQVGCSWHVGSPKIPAKTASEVAANSELEVELRGRAEAIKPFLPIPTETGAILPKISCIPYK